MQELDRVLAHLARIAAQHGLYRELTGALMIRLFGQNFAGLQVDGETQLGGRNGKERPCDRAERLPCKARPLGENVLETDRLWLVPVQKSRKKRNSDTGEGYG